MAEIREEGYYWVKVFKDYQWQIAYWYYDSKVWRLANPVDVYANVYKVGSRILQPKKERRREGHYWVKIKDKKNWEIGHWDMELEFWTLLGTELSYNDNIFEKIGPRLSPPEGEE